MTATLLLLLFEYVAYGIALPLLFRELVLLHDARREERAALDQLDATLRDLDMAVNS